MRIKRTIALFSLLLASHCLLGDTDDDYNRLISLNLVDNMGGNFGGVEVEEGIMRFWIFLKEKPHNLKVVIRDGDIFVAEIPVLYVDGKDLGDHAAFVQFMVNKTHLKKSTLSILTEEFKKAGKFTEFPLEYLLSKANDGHNKAMGK